MSALTISGYDRGPRLWEACAAHLATVKAAPRKVDTYRYWVEELLARFPLDFPLHLLTTEELTAWSSECRQRGNAPDTIRAKMSLASGIFKAALAHGYDGPTATIPYPHVPKITKWWLTPQLEKEALQWCQKHGEQDLSDLIVWTTETGLRLEETLRCTSQHFIALETEKPELNVPGTKTSTSQATLPISLIASALASRRLASSQELFSPTSYTGLARRWRRCRKALGITDTTATLKAMRRAFARKATVKGMPLPILQQAMRHSDPSTTLDYLRLTGGGYSVDEMRRYL